MGIYVVYIQHIRMFTCLSEVLSKKAERPYLQVPSAA